MLRPSLSLALLPLSLLLRHLLIVLLLVNTASDAWAAARMASMGLAPASQDMSVGHHAAGATGSDCHAPATDATDDAMPCGSDSQHCDCLHHCSALPGPQAPLLAAAPVLAPPSRPVHHSVPPRLADPVRPPIMFPA